MFYFFFESRDSPKDDPVVIWLTGGPGCGSELALFYENGPFHIADDLSLVWNQYGWDKVIKNYSTLRKYIHSSLSRQDYIATIEYIYVGSNSSTKKVDPSLINLFNNNRFKKKTYLTTENFVF